MFIVSFAAMLHFSFWLGPGISHEVAYELVYVLLHLSSLTRLKGSWGQLWPKIGPKAENK